MLERIGKGILVILFVWVSCGVWVSKCEAQVPALSGLSGTERQRVANLIEGAKKEGKLLGYSSSLRPDTQEHIFPKFRERYGLSAVDLEINIVSTRSDALITKVTEELRAKVYKTDIAHSGTVDWFNDLVERGELMAYDSPEYRHFCPLSVNPELGPTNPPYFIAGYFGDYCLLYNPKYVKGEILHWKDVLRPEYKGKISCADVYNSASYTEGYLAMRKALGASFFQELAKQDPFFLVSATDLLSKAITGEYPIVVMGGGTFAFRENLNGAGIKIVFPSEGWAAIGRQMVILAHAPHPNASKLFLDFYHSEVAQKILLEQEGSLVGRLGLKSKYPEFPAPIYDIKGAIPMDWRKLTTKDRDNAREEFKRLMIEKK